MNLTNADGEVIKSYTYHAFGVEKNIDENDTNAFRYCGEYFDTETGTIYLRARYYNPSTGRFISRDSFAGKLNDPLSQNLYTYCRNNPLRYVDPSGHSYAEYKDENGKTQRMSINSPADVRILEERRSGKATLSQVKGTTAPQREVTPITGGISVPTTNTTTYTTAIQHDAGPFRSVDEAAVDFYNNFYSSSLYIRHEYATKIYSQNNGTTTEFYYSIPVVGQPHSVGYDSIKLSKDSKWEATVHTHPNSNEFSDADINNAINRGLNTYVMGPDLNIQCYDVEDDNTSSIGIGYPRSLNSYGQTVLQQQYQTSWNEHLGDCNFGCEDMIWPTP